MARYGSLIAILVVSQLVGSNYVTNLLNIIGLFALPALGLALLMGYAGQISLGHAGFYGMGAFGSALLAMHTGISPWITIPVVAVLVGIFAWGIGWLVFRLRGHHLAMATLAFGIIVHVCLVEFRSLTGGPNGLPGIPVLSFFGTDLYSDARIFPLIWIACILALVAAENLVRSPVGLFMRALGENERAAASLGIAPDSMKRSVMMLSGAFAGFAGGLYAHYIGYLSPGPFDVGMSIKLLVMVAIGGFTSIWGVLLGVAFVTLISEVLKPLGAYDILVFGAMLVFIIIYCPRGILYPVVHLLGHFGRKQPARAEKPL